MSPLAAAIAVVATAIDSKFEDMEKEQEGRHTTFWTSLMHERNIMKG